MDAKTNEIAAEWIANFDAAVHAENLEEMSRIVDAVCGSPNQPFRAEVLRQIAA